MEEDGFAYDGAAVYDAETHQCLRVYGDYPDEKAREQAAAFALEHDTSQQNTAELPAFLDMHLIEANLLDDGGHKHKRQEIFEYFQAHKGLAERTEFLKNSYNDIWVEVLTDGVRTGYTYDSFLMLLRRNGYEVRRSPNRKYTTVKPPGAKRAIRLDSLGEGYTEADIMARLSKQRHGGMAPPTVTHTVKRYRMKGKLATVRKKKITGFHALYLRYLYLLRGGRRKKLPPKLPFSVKREVIHLERYEQQFKYLLSSGITTETELEQRIRVLEWDIRLLEEQRKPLYQERRNTSDEEAQAKYSAEIQQQTATLREKRGELRLCRRIQSDIPRVSQQCQQAQAERQENLKNKEEHEHEYQR